MKVTCLLIAVACVFSSFAQTPVDKKQQKENDQSQTANKLLLESLNKIDDYIFKKTKDSIPAQFSNESVVILGQSFSYMMLERSGVPVFSERIKKRIYLKDKAAVEDYSTFYTYTDGTEYPISVQVIKPTGTVNTLQLKDGVKETSSIAIPRSMRSSSNVNLIYYKYAIPNLEPGDIIEYTFMYDNKNIATFDPVLYLNASHVVLNSQIRIAVHPKLKVFYKNLNGAPDFKQTTEGNTVILILRDGVRNKIGNDWMLPYEKEIPYIKFCFQMYGANTEAHVNKEIKYEDLHMYMGYMLPTFFASQLKRDMASSFPEINPLTNTDAYIEKCWYILKYYSVSKSDKLDGGYGEYGWVSYNIPHAYIMMGSLCELLTINKQKYDVYLTKTNRESPIQDYLWGEQLEIVIKWKGNFIVVPFISNSYNVLSDVYSGSNAYLVSDFELRKITRGNSMPYTKTTLPVVVSENSRIENISVKLTGEQFSSTQVTINTVAKGRPATDEMLDYINRDFANELGSYLKMYKPVDSAKLYTSGKPEKIQEQYRKAKEGQVTYFNGLKEHYTELAKADYPNLSSYNSYTFGSYGLLPSATDFKMEKSMTLESIVVPAGNGYMVELGYLLGNYSKFEEEDRTRNFDGQLYGLNSLEFKIKLEIPAGYKVSTLGDLNKTYEDAMLVFNSTAVVEGNTVLLTVKRTYKKLDFTVDEYKSIVKYYDLMSGLKKTKLTIKKI
jgi:hypothetical protein